MMALNITRSGPCVIVTDIDNTLVIDMRQCSSFRIVIELYPLTDSEPLKKYFFYLLAFCLLAVEVLRFVLIGLIAPPFSSLCFSKLINKVFIKLISGCTHCTISCSFIHHRSVYLRS